MPRRRRIDIAFADPTGRGRVQVIREPQRPDAPDVEYCRLQIEKTAAGAGWQSQIAAFALLTDAEVTELRDAPDACRSSHASGPIVIEPPRR